jgi:hypothetical protein
MAGTRGLAKFGGNQLKPQLMRDYHFDAANKLNEDKVNIQWLNHREVLEATKVDVFVQVNAQPVAGLNSIEITAQLNGKEVASDNQTEGVVTGVKIDLRQAGTEDFPFIDADGDRVYGKIRFENGKYFLDFFSEEAGAETAYTFASDAVNMDFRYILRSNLSVIPVDALIKGGAGFVEGATDANAYMNLNQIMKDLYVGGSLDNDGNANLAKPIVQQILDEIQAREDGDEEVLNILASTLESEGSSLVGVVADPNYTGANVQAVLASLASRLVELETNGGEEIENARTRDAATANGVFSERTGENAFTALEDRFEDIENVVDVQVTALAEKDVLLEDRVEKLETEDIQEVYEATGGETGYTLAQGVARPGTFFLAFNGQLQAPGLHYELITNAEGNITGVTFAPDTLTGGDAANNIPADWLMVWYKQAFTA